MTTAKAIETVREKKGASQAAFANELSTTITTVSRWENGKSQPTRRALKKLAIMAREAGADHLADFFEAQIRASIIARVEKAVSAGAERHISLSELLEWHKITRGNAENLRERIGRVRQLIGDLIEHHPNKRDATIRAQSVDMGLNLVAASLMSLAGEMELYIYDSKPKPIKPGRAERERSGKQ